MKQEGTHQKDKKECGAYEMQNAAGFVFVLAQVKRIEF